jgi:hypothetical protein
VSRASSCVPAVMSAAPDQSTCLMMHTLCRWAAARDLCGHTWSRPFAHRCLLALGLVRDLGELGFCRSGQWFRTSGWSSLVVVGHC